MSNWNNDEEASRRAKASKQAPPRVGQRSDDGRYFAPATERNTKPILGVLKEVLPARSDVLEIGSGTGQHVAAFAKAFPGINWQPSEPSPGGRNSIVAWVAEAGVANVDLPLDLETVRPQWFSEMGNRRFDAILCINMIHIAPWPATEGLFEGASALLTDRGIVYLYGPFKRNGSHTAPSNAAFDARLREENPAWGIRDTDEVAKTAETHGLVLDQIREMPVNNLSLIFRKPAPG